MDYIVIAPGENITILVASSLREARSLACENFGRTRLPKGTIVKRYTESDWN